MTTSVTRRRFLAATAGILLAPHVARAASRRHVVIVGAGLAGLVCADALARMGFRVTVFEARDRVGGRVVTIRDPFPGGRHAEAGGEFVGARDTQMRAFARRFQLALDAAPAQMAAPDVFRNDRRHAWHAFLTSRVNSDLRRYAARLRSLSGAALDARSAAWLIRDLQLGDRARFLVEHDIRDGYGVEPESLSLLFLAQQAEVRVADNRGLRFRGGADLLPLALARDLDVRLETPVSAILHTRSGVTVTAGGNDLTADDIVVTAPVRTLGSIAFEPDLSSTLTSAIERLGYGHGVKTIVQYARGFEPRAVLSDLSFQTAWPGGANLVTAYTTGRNGLLYGTIARRTRPLLVADELGEAYPSSRSRYLSGESVAWHTDGWSLGTAVAYAPGQVTRFQNAVRRPIGRVHFAGEHTDALTGTMEGAVRSGLRAATAIAQR